MSASVQGGPRTMGGSRDSEGYREFTVAHIVKTTDTLDGPQVVMGCSSLPGIGSEWNFGNDFDVWCFCYPDMTIRVFDEKEGDPTRYWLVEQKFSNKPLKRCQDTNIEDPLMEPVKISGSFIKDKQHKNRNYDGTYIITSAYERLAGPATQFDVSNPSVQLEKNYSSLDLPLFSSMIDTVNDDVLWGLPARCIKLSDAPWSRQQRGVCSFYFTKTYHFDINYNTWDRDLLDEGTRVLRGHWQGDDTPSTADDADVWIVAAGAVATNPLAFIRAKDRHGENIRMILDGHGVPWNAAGTTGPGTIRAKPYTQSNFLLLGIPTDLETGI